MTNPGSEISSAEAGLDAHAWRALVAGHPVQFRVSGKSMYPTLRPGDTVQIEAKCRDSAVGEVVVYLREERLIIHRFLGNGRYRGDGCLTVDAAVNAADMIGIVRQVERGGRQTMLGRGMPTAARCFRARLWLQSLIHRAARRGKGLLQRGCTLVNHAD